MPLYHNAGSNGNPGRSTFYLPITINRHVPLLLIHHLEALKTKSLCIEEDQGSEIPLLDAY